MANPQLVPHQLQDKTLSVDEAYSACGPAAAVAFARAYGRNPTLREALDMAKQVGWTVQGGMNGIANQQRLLERMGIPSELAPTADEGRIRQSLAAGSPVTISTGAHYYVVDGVDERTGRYHVGNSGLARKGGSQWMTLQQISNLDGGINGALYTQAPQTTGGQRMEPQAKGPSTVDRMKQRRTELERTAENLRKDVEALSRAGEGEKIEAGAMADEIAAAQAARADRIKAWDQRKADLQAVETSIRTIDNDIAGGKYDDPEEKPKDPVAAEKDQIALEAAKLALEQAKKKAAEAPDPTAKKAAEVALAQAEHNLEQAKKKANSPSVSVSGRRVIKTNPDGTVNVDVLPETDDEIADRGIRQQNAGSSRISAEASRLSAQVQQGELSFEQAKEILDRVMAVGVPVEEGGKKYRPGLNPGNANRATLGMSVREHVPIDYAAALGNPGVNNAIYGDQYEFAKGGKPPSLQIPGGEPAPPVMGQPPAAQQPPSFAMKAIGMMQQPQTGPNPQSLGIPASSDPQDVIRQSLRNQGFSDAVIEQALAMAA